MSHQDNPGFPNNDQRLKTLLVLVVLPGCCCGPGSSSLWQEAGGPELGHPKKILYKVAWPGKILEKSESMLVRPLYRGTPSHSPRTHSNSECLYKVAWPGKILEKSESMLVRPLYRGTPSHSPRTPSNSECLYKVAWPGKILEKSQSMLVRPLYRGTPSHSPIHLRTANASIQWPDRVKPPINWTGSSPSSIKWPAGSSAL